MQNCISVLDLSVDEPNGIGPLVPQFEGTLNISNLCVHVVYNANLCIVVYSTDYNIYSNYLHTHM